MGARHWLWGEWSGVIFGKKGIRYKGLVEVDVGKPVWGTELGGEWRKWRGVMIESGVQGHAF